MSPLPQRMGTAEQDTLLALIRRGGTWTDKDRALYESRSFTADLLERLADRGYVRQEYKEGRTVYHVSSTGRQWKQDRPFLR